MKTILEDLGRKIGETAEIITNKAGEAVEIQRLRSQIRSLERGNERDYMELGRKVYEQHANGEVLDSEVSAICEAIQSRGENIAKYEQLVADAKGAVVCELCGKYLDKEMMYCPYCGAKAPEPKEQPEESAECETDECQCECECECESGQCECGSDECECKSSDCDCKEEASKSEA